MTIGAVEKTRSSKIYSEDITGLSTVLHSLTAWTRFEEKTHDHKVCNWDYVLKDLEVIFISLLQKTYGCHPEQIFGKDNQHKNRLKNHAIQLNNIKWRHVLSACSQENIKNLNAKLIYHKRRTRVVVWLFGQHLQKIKKHFLKHQISLIVLCATINFADYYKSDTSLVVLIMT